MSKLTYFFKQGIKNMRTRRGMSAAAVCIVSASLVMLGIFTSAAVNIKLLNDKLGADCEINVYLSHDDGGRTAEEIGADLRALSGVSNVKFFSREDRLKKVTDEVYGGDGYSFAEGTNPLRDSYIVTAVNLSETDGIAADAEKIAGVEEVIRSQDIIGNVEKLIKAVRNGGMWIAIIFVAAAVFIISSTIGLGMIAHENEIGIMRTVGATNGFITAPFVVQGFLIGFLGAVFASVVTVCGYFGITDRVSKLFSSDIVLFVDAGRFALTVVPMFLVIGVLVGITGSVAAVRKYLRD